MSKALTAQSKVVALDEILGITIYNDVAAPSGSEKGFAPGCIWVNLAGSADAQIFINHGTKLVAAWDTFKSGVVSNTTATATELNLLSGLLATAAEINRNNKVSTRAVAGGSSLTATQALHDGKTILLDTAAGTTVILPLATGTGMRLRCAVSVTATSNSHVIKAATGSTDTLCGFIDSLDLDGTALVSYKANGNASTDDTITLNRTTTGGVIGDWVELEDVVSGIWLIRGKITCVAGSNVATPFSATV